jgi:RHS repeat-associated protein
MSIDIGFNSQTPSLPQGGGAIASLGETFTPDLSTGVGTLAIPIDIPNGPNDIAPKLVLQYSTASGNGAFGMGFSLTPIPRLLRSTSQGFPHFDASDTLTLEGAGDLVDLGGGSYRPQVDGGAWQVQKSGDGFRITDRSGLYYFLGVNPAARIAGDGIGQNQVYAWHLEQIVDSLGNTAQFVWNREQNQLYLSSITYGIYQLQFQYEQRPDPVRWGRAGFLTTTALRCTTIELRLPTAAQPLLRRWTLSYKQDPVNDCSLVSSITLSGFAESNSSIASPVLKLDYSAFQTRNLMHFEPSGEDPGPGPFTGSTRRVELVDWNANGLPDLMEIGGGGRARLWPNLGEATWGHPQDAGTLPLIAEPTAPVAFADMNGDGFADLIRVDKPVSGFIPRIPKAGFGRPVYFSSAPSTIPSEPNCRLIDLDGDGMVDLLSSSQYYLTLYFRADAGGWALQPQVVSRGVAPDVDLEDPHVFLADMIGDGSPDIVRVDGGGVTYWPYLGLGRWAEPVIMQNPPSLPYNLEPRRMFLTDIDGDGCADLIYLDQGRVLYWINQSGNRFSEVQEIDYVPTGAIDDARLADMLGSGTAGILWSSPSAFERTTNYFYLDFSGASKPYLLIGMDNGCGLATGITYTTSVLEAIADARKGNAWTTNLPVVIPLISEVSAIEQVTGRERISRYHYHDGRYDGVLREFAGFGQVDQEDVGDASIPTLLTTSWFHIGVDPQTAEEPIDDATRRHLRAIRGRLYRRERRGEDGTPLANLPYDSQEYSWDVVEQLTAGGIVYLPRMLQAKNSTFERAAAAAAVVTTTNAAWDANANITDATEKAEIPGDVTKTKTLRTVTTFATDPNGRFLAKPLRTQQFDGNGTLIGDQITVYDNQAEGQIAAQGLITKRSALAVSDATVAAAYGASVPDFATLKYYRRAGSSGWWIDQGRYQRTDDASGLNGVVTGPNGATLNIAFDPTKAFPAKLTDPRGNSIQATQDYRVSRVATLTDAGGQLFSARFDPLSRIVARVEPGDTSALPTLAFSYDTAHIPVSQLTQIRTISGDPATVDARSFYDGELLELEKRVFDETGEIAIQSRIYNARGMVHAVYVAWHPPTSAYSSPAAGISRVLFTYDPLGRPLTRTNPDGGVRTWAYGPGFIDETEETGKTTRKYLDATLRVAAIEEHVSGRTLLSTYTYDVKGNVLAHTDNAGNVVSTSYDTLSRVLRVQRPEQDSISVFDPVGNPVETRSPAATLISRTYDACNRPVSILTPASVNPIVQFTYQDANTAPPPDAGVHTGGGRCVRIDDESGSTIFDYDVRGRTVLRRSMVKGSAQIHDINLAYRSDGKLRSITHPAGAGARLTTSFTYNKRGLLASIPGAIVSVAYDLEGRRTAVQYANGVQSTYLYDDLARLTQLDHGYGGATFRAAHFGWDSASNLTRVTSPDANLAATFTYDDLHRLVQAATDAGDVRTYSYDDAGNFTNKSDVGAYKYGENGAPPTCLTSAGAATFTYTALGQMLTAPWGTQLFDNFGRLTTIVGNTTATFTYNYAGERVSASFTTGGRTSTRITPDILYAIEDGNLVRYLFDGVRVFARDVDGGARTYLHEDHLGSIVAMTDQAGAVLDAIRYDAFGAVVARTAAGSAVPIGFATGQLDDATGLLYLQSRYYHPTYGRFVSPDTIVQDVFVPIAWNAYTYCRNNPQSYIDPSGRSWWKILVSALAIVALVVLAVVTFGAATPISIALGVAVVAGVVAGGVIGGVSAALAGGDLGDIVLGALVGAAVGGWAAFGGAIAGGAIIHALGTGLWSSVLAGSVSGAINGAAIGFATGFAGGHTTLDKILEQVAMGALVGAAVGAALGAVSYAFSQSTQNLSSDLQKAAQPPPQAGAPQGPPSSMTPQPPATVDDPLAAAGKVAGGLGTKFGLPLAEAGARAILQGPFQAAAVTLLVDSSSGLWDLGYLPKWIVWGAGQLGIVPVYKQQT